MTAAKTTSKPRAAKAKKPERASFAEMPRKVNARFDNAQTTSDNMRHWADADGMSPDAAYSPQVRKTLRERARLEVENNPYARGIVQTKVNDIVGSGPRLQMITGNERFNERFEAEFEAWADQIRLWEKLKIFCSAKITDGEAFGEMVTNMGIEGPVKLDLNLLECDRVTANTIKMGDPFELTDGIELDRWGNPARYNVLINHPGDIGNWTTEAQTIAARFMLHYFRRYRPEQHRGVSEFAPCLNLFAELRRYTSAVIAAAETAADFAAVLKTMQPPEDMTYANPFEALEINKRMMTTLPEGYDIQQLKAEQPTSQYAAFVRSIVTQIGRAFNMPFLQAGLDASQHNFASAKLDSRTYIREIRNEQKHLEWFLNRMLRMFAIEIGQVNGFRSAPNTVNQHAWMWEQMAEVDPREAGATSEKLRSNQTTLYEVYAARGQDWLTHGILQIAREKKAIEKHIGSLTPNAETHHNETDDDETDTSDPSDD